MMADGRFGNPELDNRGITPYKVAVSIIFGLLGFLLNFHTINFPFPPYTATVLIGLMFPMLITLAWGWRYGLLAAIAGGCQSMWWLWGPINGYATPFVVIPFTLWIAWHGFFADLRRRRKDPEWWLNPYVVEIPFRILSTINLYTLARWAITFNPPSWGWASGAASTIPLHFSTFVVIKQFVVAYIILLLADVLLNLGFTRRFLKLAKKTNQMKTGYVISASLLFGVLFWVIDSVVGSLVFYAERSFLDLLALDIPPYVLYVRTAFVLAGLAGGMVASGAMRKQREGERALEKREEQLRSVLDNATIHIWAFDGERYLYLSKEWYRYTGQNPALPRTIDRWTEVIHPDDLDATVGTWQKAWRSKVAYDDDFRLNGVEGGYRSFHSHAVPIYSENGNFQHYQGYNIDTTKQKEAETKLAQTVTDLMRSNAELEQFAYVASHDLQEPLRMVSSYVQLLKRRYAGKLDSDADDFIGFAVDGAKRMQTLIQDLLIYSRVGTRGKPFEPTNCENVLSQALMNLKVTIDENDAVVTHDPLPTVAADSSQLAQIFQNLIGNAIKFRGEDVPRVHVAAERKEGEWLFSVADNGIGIEKEFFERIFVIFQRLHNMDEYSGTGIGLAVCKKIVERHDGRMWVESEQGKGATFY
ncbi:MAG: ATP-binding protein, partial [Euryarchaeota archaeon]|nr:ATP-binding protein [Euryarchaeota archaeon]